MDILFVHQTSKGVKDETKTESEKEEEMLKAKLSLSSG
jgi:hypothetical protein